MAKKKTAPKGKTPRKTGKRAGSGSPIGSLSRMTPEQEVDFILGVTGCEVTEQQRETMRKMAALDNQTIQEEYGGMY